MGKQLITENAGETEAIGEAIGKRLHGGEVIELASDVGGGKTTFMRGLARGAGSSDQVSSPTFTISNLYKADRLELYHFDFYRLDDAGLMEHEVAEALENPQAVLVIEWGGVVEHVLPKERLSIGFEPTSEEGRKLTITCPEKLEYLVEDL